MCEKKMLLSLQYPSFCMLLNDFCITQIFLNRNLTFLFFFLPLSASGAIKNDRTAFMHKVSPFTIPGSYGSAQEEIVASVATISLC